MAIRRTTERRQIMDTDVCGALGELEEPKGFKMKADFLVNG